MGMKRQPEDPHFSSTVLDLSERVQQAIGHTKVGGRIVGVFTGSTSPVYRQLDWRSQNIKKEVKGTVKVAGDPQAGRLARNWNESLLMAASEEGVGRLKDQAGAAPYKEAVAYVSESVVHVGTLATEDYLFTEIAEEKRAIAMRRGRGPLQATMGLWLPEDRMFLGAEDVWAVDAIPVSALPSKYPGVLLT